MQMEYGQKIAFDIIINGKENFRELQWRLENKKSNQTLIFENFCCRKFL